MFEAANGAILAIGYPTFFGGLHKREKQLMCRIITDVYFANKSKVWHLQGIITRNSERFHGVSFDTQCIYEVLVSLYLLRARLIRRIGKGFV